MIERVARALALRSLKRAAERNDESGGHSAWTLARPAELKRLIDYDWRRFEEDATDAIAAMREPTEAMLDRGPGEPYMDRGVWGAMIDAELA